MNQILIHMVFSFLSSISFAVICNVPRKSIPIGGLVGMCGWMGYWILSTEGYGVFLSSIVCSLLLAFAGQISARIFKMPLTVFYVPGLVPIVPGITAFQAFRLLTLQDYDGALIGFLNVGYCAVGIAIGLVVSDILFKSSLYMIKNFKIVR
ncbi:threonine/serine exporter [Pradoshia sp. D12]|uniref:threonine/serine exporter family protein n=1 Tax=Bacillaceae TaxID=186817 RepID=UPI0009809164|nr:MULTISPECIES: threonine/serine exporter family protein [Bacillaceae]QFK71099.1 threonine/serine exporter [Pradoshia sp. D12]TPF72891.1 threonine/serine exporter [Bacillus sp. D12]